MVIEARDLVDLGHRHAGFVRERDQVPLVQAEPAVVQQVQVLDQPITPPAGRRLRTEQRAHVGQRGVVDLPALQPAVALDAPAHLVGADRGHHRHRHLRVALRAHRISRRTARR